MSKLQSLKKKISRLLVGLGFASAVKRHQNVFVIDTSCALTTMTVVADSTFVFSATPPFDTWFTLSVTNMDHVPVVLTFPYSFSVALQVTILSCVIPSGRSLLLTWRWNGSSYILYGETLPIIDHG